VDKKGKILFYNNFNDKINKLNSEETIGKKIDEVYPWVNENTPIFKVMKKKQPILNKVFQISIDGKEGVTAINSAYPLINDKGIIGAVGLSYVTNFSNKSNSTKKQSSFSSIYTFEDLQTANPEMKNLITDLYKSSKSKSNIFIFGESGTGKEILAHSIHNSSERSNKPFVTQNCGAIPENLMESIFFGTSKGSFTGSEQKIGLLDVANGGTLFLDEINSMPMGLQSKLLRVIESHSFRRVGGTKEFFCDIRFITSSNVNKETLLKNYIRQDLFYRLNVVNAVIPPLRERPEDVEILSKYFFNYFNNIFNKNILRIESPALKKLQNYSWPGNVRELKNVIESCYNIIEEGNEIREIHLPSYINEQKDSLVDKIENSLTDTVESFERKVIENALKAKRYNIVRTAKYLKIPRQTLYYKLKKYDLLENN
ncbi:MAG: sigma 54-interacting transcriptional regulator, partial [Bacillota bacterium]|nr:sigma 54-interacting transcriptional regulator [Bacillota bacterium]